MPCKGGAYCPPLTPPDTGICMANDNRTNALKIRFSDLELERVREFSGSVPLARWIREIALSGGKVATVKHQFPPEVVRALAGIGNNLNQIARNLNRQRVAGERSEIETAQLLVQLKATQQALSDVTEYLKK